jgi:hypothetical protein
MNNSVYWQARRISKKVICTSVAVFKEAIELVWVIYGLKLYASPESKGCGEKNSGSMLIMLLFLLLGALKAILFSIVVCLLLYFVFRSKL